MNTILGLDAESVARVADATEARRASAMKMPRFVTRMIRGSLGLRNEKGAIGQHTTVQDGIPGNATIAAIPRPLVPDSQWLTNWDECAKFRAWRDSRD